VAKTVKFLLEQTSISFTFDYFNTSETKLTPEKKSAKTIKKENRQQVFQDLIFLTGRELGKL
jgi:hypothetical protein